MEKRTDEKGFLHLKIPAEIKSGKTEVIIIINPINEKTTKYDFSDIAGKLEWRGDPLKMQKKLR